jgi:hypothetical protein
MLLCNASQDDASEERLAIPATGRERVRNLHRPFGPLLARRCPRPNRPTLEQWNLVVSSHKNAFNRIAAAKLKRGETLKLSNPLGAR